MSKRFTDTEKFTDPWYRRLSTKNKLLWDWMLCSCDHAGFISIDLEFVEMVLSESYAEDVIENHFSDRLVRLGAFKYFIPKFIKFQYGKLNPESRIHRSIIKKLEEHGINHETINADLTRLQRVPNPTDTLKDKEQEQEQDKDKNKVKEKEKDSSEKNLSKKEPLNFRNPQDRFTPDHVVDIWNGDLGKTNGMSPGLGSGKHLRNCIEAIQFLPDAPAWSGLFTKTKKSAFLMGDSKRGWRAPLTWLVDYDNALRVLAGEFDNGADEEDLYSKIREKSA